MRASTRSYSAETLISHRIKTIYKVKKQVKSRKESTEKTIKGTARCNIKWGMEYHGIITENNSGHHRLSLALHMYNHER